MQEKWIKWEPLVGLEIEYLLHSFKRTKEGDLVIKVTEVYGKIENINIIFKSNFFAFQHTNESFGHERFSKDYSYCWRFYKIENSKLLKSFVGDFAQNIDTMILTHYVFVLYDDMIDVISSQEPSFERFNNPKE